MGFQLPYKDVLYPYKDMLYPYKDFPGAAQLRTLDWPIFTV